MAEHAVLRVTVEAKQRLALGTGSEVSYFTGTHQFIPGSDLRGALAAAWITEHGPPTKTDGRAAEFRALFDGPIRYGPLHVSRSEIAPVSARQCKYPKGPGCKATAVDAAFESGTSCPACGGPAEPHRGEVILPPGVTVDRVTRISIDPATEKAVDGELYAHAALPAGTVLTGLIHGRHDWLEEPRTLRLGGRRTVGGAAAFLATPVTPEQPAADSLVSGRLIIRLIGPAIFTDAAGRPCLEPDPDLDLAACQVERRWVRSAVWQGWHAASHLPKPGELCASAGSTYRITGRADVLRRLAERLPHDGMGLRRGEGFGEVRVVTQPWRPARPPDEGRPQTVRDETLRQRHADIRALALDTGQRRWLISALREVQIERQRPTADPHKAAELVPAIMARPGVEDFSGRQREMITDLLAEPDAQLLRDLTSLLLADPPAAGSGGSEAE